MEQARAETTPLLSALIEPAVAAGDLPAGGTPTEFVAVHVMIGSDDVVVLLDKSREA